jgi:hypothetical protein
MGLTARAWRLAATLGMALLLAGAWVTPVLAQIGDDDGFDGDELVLPLLLGAAVVIAVVAYWRSRRSQPRSG